MNPVFYFDFGSPNAYLAHRILPPIEARTGTRFHYVPVLLGGLFKLAGNQAPMVAYAGIPTKLAYERREMQRFIARHKLDAFRMNPFFPVNTLRLMRGAVAAEAEGLLAPYAEAMFHFMWEDPRQLGEREVLAAAMTEAGLQADRLLALSDQQEIKDRLLALSDQQEIKDRLLANTQSAFALGAFGIPSFVVGDELFFGKDKLGDVEHELMAQGA